MGHEKLLKLEKIQVWKVMTSDIGREKNLKSNDF